MSRARDIADGKFANDLTVDTDTLKANSTNNKVSVGTGTAVGTFTTQCTAGDSNFALTAYHPTSTSARNIAKFQSNVGSTQADVVTIGCDGGIEAVGEITTTNTLSQSSNSIRTVIGNDGGSGTFGTSTNHQVKMFTNNTHVATLTTGGNFNILDGDLVIGTSGHGIDFSANSHASGMTSELLDSYEEGNFTPTYVGFSISSVSANTGRYTKIGNTVMVQVDLQDVTWTSGTGHLGISNLPFAAGAQRAFTGTFAW